MTVTLATGPLNNFDITCVDPDSGSSTINYYLQVISAPNNSNPQAPSSPYSINYTNAVQYTSTQQGYAYFGETSIASTAEFAKIAISFNWPGDYVIQLVAADGGATGYCPQYNGVLPMLQNPIYQQKDPRRKYPDGFFIAPQNCYRVGVANIQVTVEENSSTPTGMITLGAGVLAIAAIGAVIAAKLKKPEDLNAWEALDNQLMGSANTSAIFTEQSTKQANSLYQGKDS